LHLVLVNNDPERGDTAERTARDLAERCRREAPNVSVSKEVTSGHPAEILVRRSTQANLIVVGSHGRGSFTRALLGSVSTAVAMHSSCPVVVVRQRAGVTGPIVVGLDTSPFSDAVLQFALEAAAMRGLALIAMQLWQPPFYEDVFGTLLPGPNSTEIQQRLERNLAEQVSGYAEKYPDVVIRTVAKPGHPVTALAQASRTSELVVVGHRGRGGFEGMLLGSVAAGVLQHASSPVPIVRVPSAAT
jgi:nucleotide-binding universal stress UspA family protein